jgi:hypothetical protein
LHHQPDKLGWCDIHHWFGCLKPIIFSRPETQSFTFWWWDQ